MKINQRPSRCVIAHIRVPPFFEVSVVSLCIIMCGTMLVIVKKIFS